MRGMPNYPYAIVPHPIGVLPPDELREREGVFEPATESGSRGDGIRDATDPRLRRL